MPLPHCYRYQWTLIVAVWLGLILPLEAGERGARPMPTASLPLEPASADLDLPELQEPERPAPEPSKAWQPKNRAVRRSEAGEVGILAGVQMTRKGFGAQLRFLEYVLPWAAMRETLRYYGDDAPDALFAQQYGFMLGLELHPWRKSRVSPYISLQAGGDRFVRSFDQPELNLFGFEASTGIELQLARAASFFFQWNERYYPDLKSSLFVDQPAGVKYSGAFQVYFNLRWESTM